MAAREPVTVRNPGEDSLETMKPFLRAWAVPGWEERELKRPKTSGLGHFVPRIKPE